MARKLTVGPSATPLAKRPTQAPEVAARRPASGPAGDVLGNASLARPLLESLSRSLTLKELAHAHAARLLDDTSRAEVFRQHLLNLLPEARGSILELSLEPRHDYTKILHFMESGRWPTHSPDALRHVFTRIMRPLLAEVGAAWQAETLAAAAREHGPLAHTLRDYIGRSTTRVWGEVAAARLAGAQALDLTRLTGLQALPDHLFTLHQLRRLRLSGADLTTLDERLGDLHRLERLDLDGMQRLRTLPAAIGRLSSLETLNFHGEGTSERLTLPVALAELPRLRVVDVGNNAMPRPAWLPEHIKFLQVRPASGATLSPTASEDLDELDAWHPEG